MYFAHAGHYHMEKHLNNSVNQSLVMALVVGGVIVALTAGMLLLDLLAKRQKVAEKAKK